ncbi:MAG: phosphonate metabolism protein/1,5-bisphosphokinase (PRPP-forming) PhnN [Candidatus Thiodiazotropha sp. LLP2]
MAELFYVMGASGVGKDSLLQYARKKLPKNYPVVFAHRYITRAANAGGENHIALSEGEFLYRNQMGCFAMHWYCHNTWYGIGAEVNLWLSMGMSVVVNGSRVYFEAAVETFPEVIPVLITAEPELIQERLKIRARESSAEIEQRLTRTEQLLNQKEYPSVVEIHNNQTLAEAGDRFIHLLLRETALA